MIMTGSYTIQLAGLHILTVGRDLLPDRYTVIVELVKNAYDANSPDVNIEFGTSADRCSYSTSIQDHGHAMAMDIVIDSWQ